MTMKERILALLRGDRFDRVPFVQYDGMIPSEEVWAVIGRENLGRLRWTTAYRIEHPNCRFETVETSEHEMRSMRRRLVTPAGELREFVRYEPTYGGMSIKEHFIKSLDDYEAFLAYLDDITVVPDPEPLDTALAELGADGLPHTWVGRTPYQQMWIQWIDIMDLSAHLVEARELVEAAMRKLGDIMLEMTRVTLALDPPYLVIGDNVTAPMIGERYFRAYCMPYYDGISELAAEKKIPVVVHMDGDLKPLWGAIGESKIRGLDSFSPPPDNDTSAAKAAEIWPDKVLMLNFPSSVHIREEKEIYRVASEILDQAGRTGRLQIQISENVPPGVYKKSYPAIVRAINDFGDPFA